jgi:hypothetical protein
MLQDAGINDVAVALVFIKLYKATPDLGYIINLLLPGKAPEIEASSNSSTSFMDKTIGFLYKCGYSKY